MSLETEEQVHRKIPGLVALLPLLTLIIMALFSTISWGIGMLVPIITGIAVAAVIARIYGCRWAELQSFMESGVARALTAIFILLLIGIIIGTWMLGGVIPSLIYYGLSILNSAIFLPLVCLVTALVSLVIGSSFTSMATVGLAFVAMGQGMDLPLPMVVGAVISGAFFGDKLSPLSDTTNVAPAMVEENLFDHIRHMLWDTIPALAISIIIYWIVGLRISGNPDANLDAKNTLMTELDNTFVIHPALLIVVVLALALIVLRIPAIPALVGIALFGAIAAWVVQGADLSLILNAATSGYVSETGHSDFDELLTTGGIRSMFETIALVTVATALGGILDGAGMFKSLINPLISRVKRSGSMIASSVLATFIVGFSSGAQFLAIILPARGFLEPYRRVGLSPLNLSRVAEAAGTVGINLVPWSVPAVFASGLFGVEPVHFIPWVLFAFIVPALNVLYGYTGIGIKHIRPRVQSS